MEMLKKMDMPTVLTVCDLYKADSGTGHAPAPHPRARSFRTRYFRRTPLSPLPTIPTFAALHAALLGLWKESCLLGATLVRQVLTDRTKAARGVAGAIAV
jgi:hypothetical protein